MALKTPPHRLPSPRGRRGPSSPQGRVRPSLWVLTAGLFLGTAMLCYIYEAQAVSESSFSYKIPPIPSILVPESYMKLLCPSSLVNSEFSWGCVQEHGRGGYLQKNGKPQVGPSSKRCTSSRVTINGLSILREERTSSAPVTQPSPILRNACGPYLVSCGLNRAALILRWPQPGHGQRTPQQA